MAKVRKGGDDNKVPRPRLRPDWQALVLKGKCPFCGGGSDVVKSARTPVNHGKAAVTKETLYCPLPVQCGTHYRTQVYDRGGPEEFVQSCVPE
jgi:hypothetical protein